MSNPKKGEVWLTRSLMGRFAGERECTIIGPDTGRLSAEVQRRLGPDCYEITADGFGKRLFLAHRSVLRRKSDSNDATDWDYQSWLKQMTREKVNE